MKYATEKITAKILLDSVNPWGDRLTTFVVEYPRYTHGEVMTHRVKSRNTGSSRAIPITKTMAQVQENPVIPLMKENQKGMQPAGYLSEEAQKEAEACILRLREATLREVENLNKLNVHKQWANRYLEPFLYHTAIISATEWDNFYSLRIHPDAMDEIRVLAVKMLKAQKASTPRLLEPGEWHIPMLKPGIDDELTLDEKIMVGCARCARVSYLTHDGVRSVEADFELYHRLVNGGHMSPLEHVAMVANLSEFYGNFKGYVQHRKMIAQENITKFVEPEGWEEWDQIHL